MTIRKHGTGEVLPEEDDIKKASSQEQRDESLAEVRKESEKADDE